MLGTDDKIGAKTDLAPWSKLNDVKCVEKIAYFARVIPGFETLPTNDKIILIKKASIDVMVSLNFFLYFVV